MDNNIEEIDLMEQTDTYTGISDIDELFSEPSPKLDVKQKTSKPDKEPKEPKKTNTKVVLVGIGVIVVILLLVVGWFSYEDWAEKKRVQEEIDKIENFEEEVVMQYTEEEYNTLRKLGFTEDEVRSFELEEKTVSEVEEIYTEQVYENYKVEVEKFLIDDGYTLDQLLSSGWDSLKPANLEGLGEVTTYVSIFNCDYEKLPAKGLQLFIKLITPNGNVLFAPMNLERYTQLADSGNINMEIEYEVAGNGQMAIIRMTEVSIGE